MSEAVATPVLSVRDLSVQVATEEGAKTVLDKLSFDLLPGRTLALAGESGSGKSMTALAIMGLLPQPMARVAGGSIRLGDVELTDLGEWGYRRVRSARVAMIFQEPMTSLNPLMTIERQLAEVLLEHGICGRRGVRARALELLEAVRLTEPRRRLRQYPHELSGGMRQRVMIAMALACDPEILIADEPTTALDVTVQAEILDLIRNLQAEHGTAVLMITHDMGVVAEMADRVIVLRHGREMEAAETRTLFAAPKTEYAQDLLAAVPRLGTAPPRAAVAEARNIVEVEDLSVRFAMRGGVLGRTIARVHAVEGVSFHIRERETLALVGESGCGKSTIGKALLGLVPWEGSIRVGGVETHGRSRATMRPVLRDIQMVFQDPGASLDARMSVGEQVVEPMRVHDLAHGSELSDRAEWLFGRVGLSADMLSRFPHEFSGGQRQRICIARALSLSPKVIVADESVSALDVSVQAQVLELLRELQEQDGLAYLFISHDMAVVEQVADRVMVMRLGQVMEEGPRDAVLRDPQHPYTRRLIAAVPVPDPTTRRPALPATEGVEAASPIFPVGSAPGRIALHDIAQGHRVAREAAVTP
ncbi:ABC transporter ATP-binding protein [Palleronia sp. LCG004]|uniref:ABC transporter ATP-binding protein n=1 Tax=Palleronia sp. LCG004 TaxID=3079304 RepID=UPI0029433B99|nr:ABC transporter ATP-binding protein [Palleronia sp. LCG004]WOI57125.1 ABC transporter ATP-binding protein [Palleronia sp. LCG004]